MDRPEVEQRLNYLFTTENHPGKQDPIGGGLQARPDCGRSQWLRHDFKSLSSSSIVVK